MMDCGGCANDPTGCDYCALGVERKALKLLKQQQKEYEEKFELLKKAVRGLHGICKECKKYGTCTSRTGSHKNCWQWKHGDIVS